MRERERERERKKEKHTTKTARCPELVLLTWEKANWRQLSGVLRRAPLCSAAHTLQSCWSSAKIRGMSINTLTSLTRSDLSSKLAICVATGGRVWVRCWRVLCGCLRPTGRCNTDLLRTCVSISPAVWGRVLQKEARYVVPL